MPHSIPLEPIPYEREIRWASTRVLLHADRINQFLSLKEQIEQDWIQGLQESTEKLVNEVEASCGVSFFLAELRIALLQQWHGLEPQKSYATEIRRLSRNGLVRYATYFISQRNETATNPMLFKERVDMEILHLDHFIVDMRYHGERIHARVCLCFGPAK
jgi:hypothetical protein